MSLARALLLGIGVLAAACSSSAAAPLALLTLNIANGAGAVYRAPDNRARQAGFVAHSGAVLVGLEEVDVDVARSGHTDSGAEVLGLPCASAAPPISADGVRRCDSAAGTYLFGVALRGDDTYDLDADGQPAGIPGEDGSDRSHDALYGVALGVRGYTVSDAYAVELPTATDQPPGDALYTALGQSGPGAPARAELAARNLVLRSAPALEPRLALVARLERPGTAPLVVIETHLEIASFADVSANQLARVLFVAAAERAGPPAREVVVMGDFNGATVARAGDLMSAGVRRALDWPTNVGSDLDQIWVDSDLLLLEKGELATGGISDHPVAVRATIR